MNTKLLKSNVMDPNPNLKRIKLLVCYNELYYKSQAPSKSTLPGLKPGSDDVVTETIKEGVYSLNIPEFEHCDKTVNPDVMD